MATLPICIIGLVLLAIGQSKAIYIEPTFTNADSQHIHLFDRQPEYSLKRWIGYTRSLKQLLYLSANWKMMSNEKLFSPSMRGFSRVRNINKRLSSARSTKRMPLMGNEIRNYACDTTRLTIQTIIEYVRSGTICGFQVAGIRFGLGK